MRTINIVNVKSLVFLKIIFYRKEVQDIEIHKTKYSYN